MCAAPAPVTVPKKKTDQNQASAQHGRLSNNIHAIGRRIGGNPIAVSEPGQAHDLEGADGSAQMQVMHAGGL